MKKLLCILIVLLSIIVSGCGEESDAIKVLKESTEKNLKLAQMQDKTAVEYARELGATIYHTTCKIYKFDTKIIEEQNKLINERDKVKYEATMKMLDLGGKSIFNLPKAKEDALKEINEAEQKITDYKGKHKEYFAAVDGYLKSISAVIQMNNGTLGKKNDVIDPFIRTMVIEFAQKNNYKENIDFSNLDTYKYGWTKLNERLANERAAERRSLTMLGKITDERAVLVKDNTANPTVIRKLNVGEKVEVREDLSDGPSLYVIVYPTREEGYVWHKYVKYDGYKTEEEIRRFYEGSSGAPAMPQTGIGNSHSYVVNSAPQVKKQKMFNPVDTPQSVAIMKGIAGTSSSSALREGDKVFSASNIVDQNNHTCWADGTSGLGIGESITINFNQKYNISGFRIFNGYQKSEDLFNKNSRPITLRVIGSDGSNAVYNIEDSIYEQDIYFDKMINVDSIKLVIEKVQRGTKYEDTCISEVTFF